MILVQNNEFRKSLHIVTRVLINNTGDKERSEVNQYQYSYINLGFTSIAARGCLYLSKS